MSRTLILVALIFLAAAGVYFYTEQTKIIDDIKPSPFTPIESREMVDCKPCFGSGKITLGQFETECPRCEGFGKMRQVEKGVFKPYKLDFIRGYEDYKRGKTIDDCPFLLNFRKSAWEEGWLEAEKQNEPTEQD